jgi:hypothetical protein
VPRVSKPSASSPNKVSRQDPVYNRNGDIIGEKTRRNPNCATHAEYLKLKKSYAVELGLSPGSRPRLRLEKPAPEEEDPLEVFLREGERLNATRPQ